jgi:NADPH:quinone reductase-like Zn-dependent oxidoreductase
MDAAMTPFPPLPERMRAVLLTGHGGLDRLEFRDDVPVPAPAPGEVLIAVGACGMNNTDINTRTAWYSRSVTEATSGATGRGGVGGFEAARAGDSTWGGAGLHFPRIQGADVAGRIVALGAGVAAARLGQRVLVDPWLRDPEDPGDRAKAGYLGSERDGGYAEYTTVPAVNAIAIESALSDAELATFPCSSSTAEHMLAKARLGAGETLLVTGASGGVGSALVQLGKRRGATVIAVAGSSKIAAVRGLGADAVIARDTPDLEAAVRAASPNGEPGGEVAVAADIVGGPGFAGLLDLLARGGRYVTSGAIAGPMVELDLRTLYLKDLELLGATVMPRGIFEDLVGYIERGEIKPLLAGTFPLDELGEAQTAFLEKQHVGNFVILPGA